MFLDTDLTPFLLSMTWTFWNSLTMSRKMSPFPETRFARTRPMRFTSSLGSLSSKSLMNSGTDLRHFSISLDSSSRGYGSVKSGSSASWATRRSSLRCLLNGERASDS